MAIFKVVAIQDISQPLHNADTPTGRVLDITEEEENDTFVEKAGRCLRLVLCAPDESLTTAFELAPLPYSASQLLSSELEVNGAESRHGVLLLTPQCTKLVTVLPPSEGEFFVLDDDEMAIIDGPVKVA